LAYLAITESLSPSNVVAGLVTGVLATLLLRPKWRPIRVRRLPGMAWALLSYLVLLMVEIIRNGLLVAKIVLRPSIRIRSGIVAVPSGSESEMGTAVSAHAITVSPGEMVVEIGLDQVMYVHGLDLPEDPEEMMKAERRRMALIRRITD
jgi:multicomponent Na+:H+ antiporter subunit E